MNKIRQWIVGAVVGVCLAGLAPVAIAQIDVDTWAEELANESDINTLARMYLDMSIRLNPPLGGSLGIHGTDDNPSAFDDHLGNVSPEAWDLSIRAHTAFQNRLTEIDAEQLSRPDQIDLHILKNDVELSLLNMTELGDSTNPQTYVSGLGGAFSGLVLKDYAPVERRLQSLGSRCAATGRYLDEARTTLLPLHVQPTALEKQTTLSRLAGIVGESGLIKKALPEMIEASSLSVDEGQEIEAACAVATEEIETFAAWFEEHILPRPDGEWRLGKALYEKKYKPYMDYPLSPQELLAKAEAELQTTGGQLVAIARNIHDDYLTDAISAGEIKPKDELDDGDVVRNIFAKLSEDRSTAETLIDDSYALADAIISFVEERNLMDLPPTSKLRIENIPPHLQGYAVAMIQTAPPFEPELESVWFWDLELLSTSEDYLKEYNRPALALVYIHEGVPGHFVQLEYSNRFERIVPKVFGNGPMIEGWASYIQTQLVDEGFTIYPDEPYGYELQQMTDRKLILRSIINAIIDIRLHTTDWPEEEALKLMIEKGFQEEGEAQGKLARAKMSSVQLATYFAGHQAILEVLEEYRDAKGDEFSYKEFNERLVGAGSPPFFAIREFMLAED
ncbi:MAG: DUF885 domain-containing protein [Woeseiaceae bacterium]